MRLTTSILVILASLVVIGALLLSPGDAVSEEEPPCRGYNCDDPLLYPAVPTSSIPHPCEYNCDNPLIYPVVEV